MGVNVTVRVQYSDGVATFVNQVQITGNKGAFSKAGDSGSLIVTREKLTRCATLRRRSVVDVRQSHWAGNAGGGRYDRLA